MTLQQIINYYDLPYGTDYNKLFHMNKAIPYMQEYAREYATSYYEEIYGKGTEITQEMIRVYLLRHHEFDVVDIGKIVHYKEEKQ